MSLSIVRFVLSTIYKYFANKSKLPSFGDVRIPANSIVYHKAVSV